MRTNLLVVLAVLVVAIGLSLVLIPRGGEIALQKFRDQDYATARAVFEERYAAGDRSAGTVMPLTRLFLQTGDLDRAIAILEDFVAREPEQIEGREMLGTLYNYAMRPGDYLANLEVLARLRPTEPIVRELAFLYAFHADFDSEIRALRRLVAMAPPDAAELAGRLGQLLASKGAVDEAISMLESADDMAGVRPLEANARELLLALLLDTGQVETAAIRTSRWLDGHPPLFMLLGIPGQIAAAGRPDLAYRLLLPFASRALEEPPLELMLADLEIAIGRRNEARERLLSWRQRGRIDDSSLGRYVGLALSLGLPELALGVTADRDLHLIPDWALVGLAEAAFRAGDRAFIDRLVADMGEDFLADRPLFAGELALSRGDRAGAVSWAEKVIGDAGAPLDQRLQATALVLRAGRRDLAVAAFDRLDPGTTLPDDALEDYAALALDLDRAAAGLAVVEAVRTARPSSSADLAWLRLAAKAGDPAAVLAWMKDHEVNDARLLEDLYFLATDRGAAPLALLAAERLYALTPSPEHEGWLATALVNAGRPGEALPHLRRLVAAGRRDLDAPYLEALSALGLKEELAGFVDGLLKAGGMSDERETALIFTLLDHGAERAALPFLRDRAERLGGEWLFAYADASRKTGLIGPLADLLVEQLRKPGLTPEETEARVAILIDDAPERAVEALARLAEGDPARWWEAEVEVLRRLGRTDELAGFLEAMLERKDLPPTTRDGMGFALLDAAGPVRALPALQRLAEADGATWDAVYRETLMNLGRRDELKAYLARHALDDSVPAEVRRVDAFALLDLGEKAGAEAAFRKLAAAEPPTGENMRQLLFLWGPRPGKSGLDWIEARAKAARSPAEQAAWWDMLAELGGAPRVVTALDKDGQSPTGPLREPLIEALAAENKGPALAAAVEAALPGERDPERLRRYARLAEQLRQSKAAGAAWQALLALRPNDPDALRQLGMLAYDQGKLRDTERYLRQYLARSAGDYEANYFLGEALTATRRAGEAGPFYRRALDQIRALPAKSDVVLQTEANILNRMGRVDDAIAVFETLRRLRPKDKALQADFAAMLIENGRLREARNVLAVQ